MSIDLSTFGSRLATVLESALAAVSAPVGGSLDPPVRTPAAGLIASDSRDPFLLPEVRPTGWAIADGLGSDTEPPAHVPAA